MFEIAPKCCPDPLGKLDRMLKTYRCPDLLGVACHAWGLGVNFQASGVLLETVGGPRLPEGRTKN